MSEGSKAVGGIVLAVVGVVLMIAIGSRLFAEGALADATGTIGEVGPLEIALLVVGLFAFFAGVIVLGYAVIAMNRKRTQGRD